MATLPTPYSWSVADNVTATLMNSQVRDGFGFFLAPPMTLMTNSTVQNVPSSSNVLCTWDTPIVNNDGGWSSAHPSRLVAQTPGVYAVLLHTKWTQGTDGAGRMLYVTLNANGSLSVSASTTITRDTSQVGSDSVTPQTSDCSCLWYFNAGDYIEALINTTTSSTVGITSGTTSNFATYFGIRWVSNGN